MKFTCTIILLAVSSFGFAQSPREMMNFDFDRKFFLGDVSESKNPNFDTSNWQEIQLPHDWSIKQQASEEKAGKGWMAGAMGYFPGGIGWYRNNFIVSKTHENKKVVIQFDGVYHQSDVYLNGKNIKLKGMNLHLDSGSLGTAVPDKSYCDQACG